jgi:glycosyltransferase involved in cell wall biosynthesis
MRRKLRVGFVSVQDATDINTWSGIPSQVLACMRRLDVDVRVFSPLSQRIKYLLAPAKVMSRLNKSSASLDHYSLVVKSYGRQIADAMRRNPVDVIFSTSSIPIASLECTEPIVFWTDAVFHGMYNYYNGAFAGMSKVAIARARLLEEAALRRCTIAAYASEWAAESARLLADKSKVHVLPFGASFAIDHTREAIWEWAQKRRRERPNGCDLLFIGVDWVRKGGAVAVEAARILNEKSVRTTLTVVGCHPPGVVPDYVRVKGFISKSTAEGREQLRGLLRESDFFIMPSLAEAAGIVFCEASAFGLPSLAYATGGIPDYVRNDVNGVCLPVGSPADTFAEAILTILQDPARYESLCMGAFHEYESRLNWDSSVGALVDLCQQAVEG